MAFTSQQRNEIHRQSRLIGLEPEILEAFCNVEAAATVFTVVDGKQMPLIRWEGHYFYRLVPKSLQQKALDQRLASPKVGGIPNPTTQVGRYALLAKAKLLSTVAAISSTSWGIGQVMGEHWKNLGYPSAQEFEAAVCSGFKGQLEAMVRFLKWSGIIPHLKRKDWSAAARIYNGKLYAKNKYDVKLAKEYARLSGNPKNSAAVTPDWAGAIRAGSSGVKVSEVQTLLRRAGYPVNVDGDFGKTTEESVKKYQQSNGLTPDGIVGEKTYASLSTYKESASEKIGVVPVTDTSEVKKAIGTAVPIATVVAVKEELETASTKLLGINVELVQTIAGYMTAGATIIGVGLAAYAIYGIIKSRKTRTGVEASLPA